MCAFPTPDVNELRLENCACFHAFLRPEHKQTNCDETSICCKATER